MTEQDQTTEGISIPITVAGLVSSGFTLGFCLSVGLSPLTAPIAIVAAGAYSLMHSKGLRKFALLFGAAAAISVNGGERIQEIPERIIDDPIALSTGLAAVAGWGVTKYLSEYIESGEEIKDQVHLNRKRQSLIETDARLQAYKIQTKAELQAYDRLCRARALAALDRRVDAEMPDHLKAFIRSSYGMPTGRQMAFEESIPVAEFAAPAPSAPPVTISQVSDQDQLRFIPDGAKLITVKELQNINKYPVVGVIAGQGCGKSASVGWILSQMDGNKAISSPKPLPEGIQIGFDLVFGFNQSEGKWSYFGDIDNEDFAPYLDFSYFKQSGQRHPGSVLSFLWAARRESMNRQDGTTPNVEPWRCFYDEASYCYGTGYNNPLEPATKEKRAKEFVSGIMKDAFQNFRGQQVQWFYGAQIESVEAVGLKNFAAARDEAWHLYPGPAAVTAAREKKKPQLGLWLERRMNAGHGVVLLEKKGLYFEVLDMPTIKELTAFTDTVQRQSSQILSSQTPQVQSEPKSDDQESPDVIQHDDPIDYLATLPEENLKDAAEKIYGKLSPEAFRYLQETIKAKKQGKEADDTV